MIGILLEMLVRLEYTILNLPEPVLKGEINIGVTLNKSVYIRAIKPINSMYAVVAFTEVFNPQESKLPLLTRLALCNLKTFNFSIIEGMTTKNPYCGFTNITYDAKASTLLISDPCANDRNGRIIEIEVNPNFFTESYSTSVE